MKMNWINIKDKTPKIDEKVLVTDGKNIEFGFFQGNDEWFGKLGNNIEKWLYIPNDKNQEISPCPFCGYNDYVGVIHWPRQYLSLSYVVCDRCQYTGPNAWVQNNNEDDCNKSAIKSWNWRNWINKRIILEKKSLGQLDNVYSDK